jgi:hypothetical protein
MFMRTIRVSSYSKSRKDMGYDSEVRGHGQEACVRPPILAGGYQPLLFSQGQQNPSIARKGG